MRIAELSGQRDAINASLGPAPGESLHMLDRHLAKGFDCSGQAAPRANVDPEERRRSIFQRDVYQPSCEQFVLDAKPIDKNERAPLERNLPHEFERSGFENHGGRLGLRSQHRHQRLA